MVDNATQENSGRRLRRRDYLKAAGTVGALTGLAGCTGNLGGGSGPIQIGLALPSSGPFAAIGEDHRQGVDVAISERGTINDREIETVSRDTASDPQKSRNVIEELATRENVDFIVGPVSSAVGAAIADVVEKNEVLTNYPTAAAEAPVAKNCTKYVFKTSPTNDQQTRTIARWTANNLDGKVVTFCGDWTGGQEASKYYKQHLEKAGGTVVDRLFAPLSTSDFSSHFSRVKDTGADIVFVVFPGGGAVQLAKQAQEFGLKDNMKMTGLGFQTTQDVLPAIGGAASGWITGLEFAETLERQSFKDFSNRLSSETDVQGPPNLYHARGYTAAASVFKAIEEAGSTDTDKMISNLEGLEFTAPHGDIKYRAGDHQAILDYYIREVRCEGGSCKNHVIATEKSVAPPDKCDAF